jgi:predicted amidophosphoribosyltransferase
MSPYAGVLNGETCILVDDVYTSGASMEEASRVLKGYGVKKVYGFVLAKGNPA